MNTVRLSCVLSALALGACGGSAPPASGQPKQAEAAEAPHALLDSAERPMERAREVDDVTRQQKREMDRRLEEAER